MKIGCNVLYANAGNTSSVAMKNVIHVHAIYVFSLFLSKQLKEHSFNILNISHILPSSSLLFTFQIDRM